jgi:two-component system sensor histidine kinase KdpD
MTTPNSKAGPGDRPEWRGYVLGAALVVLATLAGLALQGRTAVTNLLWLYLLAALGAALWFGVYPAIFTAVLGVVAYELSFAPLAATIQISDSGYLLPLGSLIAAGILAGALAAAAHQRELAARRREAETLALFDLSQRLTAADDLPAAAQNAAELAGATAGRAAGLYLPEPGGGMRLAGATADFATGAGLETAVPALYRQEGVETAVRGDAELFTVTSSGRPAGILAVARGAAGPLSAEQRGLLLAFTSLVGLALDKAALAEHARQTRLLQEADKLQNALLNSISHDLRTPLASITGALSSLLEDEALLSPAARRDLTLTAWEEANRLNRLLQNLLNMTRLESGALKIDLEPSDVEELVGAALAQMPLRLHGRTVLRHIPRDLPPVSMDLVFMVQALVNLVDNALKYSPPEQPIEIAARQEGAWVIVEVLDRGPGLPEGEYEVLFNKFVRGSNVRGSGTGLGLAISKGIVEAHNGRLWAENRAGGGAVFALGLAAE